MIRSPAIDSRIVFPHRQGKDGRYSSRARSRLRSDRSFLTTVVVTAWLLRLALVVIFYLTDAIRILRLSPDSEKYHREGLEIMRQMEVGFFNWPNWFDNGWFQFTGFVYYLFGPNPFLIQLLNITAGSLTIVPVFLMMRIVCNDIRAQRLAAILVAFFPSLVYWSCLMLKDPVSVLALALIVYGVLSLRFTLSIGALVWILAGLSVFLGTRAYIFFVSLLLIPAALFVFPFRPRRNLARLITVSILFGLFPATLGFGILGVDYIRHSIYFDLEYINYARQAMGDHGNAALFGTSDVHQWGNSVSDDLYAIGLTVMTVFFPVDPTDIGSTRQLMFLPQFVLMAALLGSMLRGALYFWRWRKATAPVLVFVGGILAVYVAGTTNAGALFRWTTQIMPYFMMMVAVGAFCKRSGPIFHIGGTLVRVFSR